MCVCVCVGGGFTGRVSVEGKGVDVEKRAAM